MLARLTRRWELLYSGYYGPSGLRPSYRAWILQLLLYVTIAMVEKGIVLLVRVRPALGDRLLKQPG